MDYNKAALELHSKYPGKIAVQSLAPCKDRYRLAVQNFYFNLFNWYVPPLQSLSVRTDS